MPTRHTPGHDKRGNSYRRRARREWIMSAAAGFGGNGRTVPCYHCGARLRKPEIDRFPLCGHGGGRYVRSNIVPSCGPCNRRRCGSSAAPCRMVLALPRAA